MTANAIHYIPMLFGGLFAIWLIMTIVSLRVVVPTNAVHIVQTGRKTTSYGKDMGGNTYYRWPSWLPVLGVRVSVLPLSVFRVELENYAAYDKGRLPFVLDVLAFFRISDASKAAERLSSITELDGQLQGIMQGVVRTILANAEIEDILGKRAEFSEAFTKEVQEQLPQWGVETVKNIELMDIRDGQGSQVIQQIMAKKKSEIEKESRVAVANNTQLAQIAEVTAQRQVEMQKQDALEQVGIRTAQKDQQIGIQTQQAQQAVRDQEKITAEKTVAVQTVQEVGKANIQKQVQTVAAEQQKATTVIMAEGEKAVAITRAEGLKAQAATVAEGQMNAAKFEAEGIKAKGEANANASELLQQASVTPQITLAKEIGANTSYQTYLISIKQVEAMRDIGMQQAVALQSADIKIIANAGTPGEGATSAMDLFGAKGGAQLGAMITAFTNTGAGKVVADALNGAGHA